MGGERFRGAQCRKRLVCHSRVGVVQVHGHLGDRGGCLEALEVVVESGDVIRSVRVRRADDARVLLVQRRLVHLGLVRRDNEDGLLSRSITDKGKVSTARAMRGRGASRAAMGELLCSCIPPGGRALGAGGAGGSAAAGCGHCCQPHKTPDQLAGPMITPLRRARCGSPAPRPLCSRRG